MPQTLAGSVLDLFDRDCNESLSDEEDNRLIALAEDIIGQYGWDAVWKACFSFFRDRCSRPEAVINFGNLFWAYGYHSHAIPDPYRFLGLMYHRIGLDPNRYDAVDLMDSLAGAILKSAGLKNPRWPDIQDTPEKDPLLLEAAEKWASGEYR